MAQPRHSSFCMLILIFEATRVMLVFIFTPWSSSVLVQGGAVARRLPILQIQHGPSASDSIGMPVAAWLLGECLLHWAMRWRAPEVGPCALKSLICCA